MVRLSPRSAAEPPSIDRAIIGIPATKFTIPSIIALLVSVVITQLCAINCIHVPVIEMLSPSM